MPTGEDIYATDNIRVVGIATRDAKEQGLLRTVLSADVVTLRTFLAGVAWGDRNHLAPAPLLFVRQHMPKRAPALIEYRLVQTRFGGNIAPWLFHRPSGRLRHIPDLQVLDTNDRVVFAGVGRKLVQEIVAAIGNADIELRNAALVLLPVAGVLHLAGELALHPGFLRGVAFVRIERWMQRAIRERGKGGNAQVNAQVCGGRMHGDRHVQFDLKGDKPVCALSGNRHVFDGALDVPRVPELDPADFGQIDHAVIHLEALRIPEAIGQELLAILRWMSTTGKQIRVRTLKIMQALLQALGIGFPEPAVFLALLPPGDQLTRLRIGQPRHTGIVPVLIDRQNLVPDKATGSSILDELLAYALVRFHAIFIATSNYHRTIVHLLMLPILIYYTLLIRVKLLAAHAA